MGDWKTYKGQGAWTFEKSAPKPRYNEGNRIATFADPVWTTDFTGIPITDGHDPCGYWHREPTLYEPPTFTPTAYGSGLGGYDVLWLENYGNSDYGRFLIGNIWGSSIKYSDDGGYNWTTITDVGGLGNSSLAGVWKFLHYTDTLIFAYGAYGIAKTLDGGETWLPVIANADLVRAPLSLSYNPLYGKFIMGCNFGYVYESSDNCETWIQNSRLYLYGQNNYSLFWSPYTYVFTSKNSFFRSSDLTTWEDSSTISNYPDTYAKGHQAIVHNGVLYYGVCKSSDGEVWTRYTNTPCKWFDYNASLDCMIASGPSVLPEQYYGVYTSTDGDVWVQVDIPYSGLVKYGVGISDARYLNVGQSGYGVIGILSAGGTTTTYGKGQ